jgi:hypothetical protein
MTDKKTKKIGANSIKTFIESEEGYRKIYQQNRSEVFGNFDQFMDEVEKERDCKDELGNPKVGKIEYEIKKRIRATPNNIVSSRSVLIYDFQLKIGKQYVTFLIVDLTRKRRDNKNIYRTIF